MWYYQNMEANYKKITQALNWLARKEGGEINKMKAIKLVWMADRLHLREYGRPITNDDYIAMKFGPVGSVTRNITDEAIPYLTDEQFGYSRNYLKKRLIIFSAPLMMSTSLYFRQASLNRWKKFIKNLASSTNSNCVT